MIIQHNSFVKQISSSSFYNGIGSGGGDKTLSTESNVSFEKQSSVSKPLLKKFFPLPEDCFSEAKHFPYDVPRACSQATKHLKGSDGVASSEFIWLAITIALKELVKQDKIQLRTHVALNALFRFILVTKVPEEEQALLSGRYNTAQILHENFYRDFLALNDVNQFSEDAEKLIPFLKEIKIEGSQFLDFCSKRNIEIVEELEGWRHVEGWKKKKKTSKGQRPKNPLNQNT